jgi:phage shock protein PspC (stress-responsive transcriptional regulator)
MSGPRRGTIVCVMTETTAPPQGPPPGPPSRPPLYRDPDNSMFAGVCTAMARYTGTDPVIWRIVTVVLAVFGGAGAVLYALGWLLIPKIGNDVSIAEHWLRRRQHLSPAAILVVVIVAAILFGAFDDGNAVAALAVLGAVAFLVHRDRQGRPLVPSYAGAPVGPATTTTEQAPAGDATAPPAWTAPQWNDGSPTDPYTWTPPPPRPPRSRLGLATLSVAALTAGVLALAHRYGAEALTPARILAVTLLVIGSGLILGTWFGRAKWLVLVAIPLALALALTAATDDPSDTLRGGVGERTWVVGPTATAPDYKLGIGEATLDLTELTTPGRHVEVDAHIGIGHLIVLVPDDVPVRLHAEARFGEIDEFGHTFDDNGDGHVERTRRYGPAGDPQVVVDASVTAGQVEVRHG